MKSLTKYISTRTTVFTAALIGLLLVISPIVHAAQSSDYVIKQSVLSTDSTPGSTSTFGTFGYPSINANGAIAFSAYNYSPILDSAIYSTANGVAVGPLARIVGLGDTAPGVLGVFRIFEDVSLNDNGSFAFRGSGIVSVNRGIYFSPPASEIELITDASTQRPPNYTDTFYGYSFAYPIASDGGYILFEYYHLLDKGVFLADLNYSSGSGMLTELVNLATHPDKFIGGSESSLNDTGVVAMARQRSDYTRGLYVARPDGSFNLVLETGDPIPGGGSFMGIGGPSINTGGSIAFAGSDSYSSSGVIGIFTVSKEGVVTKIIDNSVAVPNHPGVTYYNFIHIHLADNGTILFTARYILDGLDYRGIYKISDAGLEVIFDQFDGIDVNGEHVSLVIESESKVLDLRLSSRFVNDRLDVVFLQYLPPEEGDYYKSGIFVAEGVVSYTPEGLTDLINNLPTDALAEELVNSLTQKVNIAEKQDNVCTAVNILGAFQNAVEAQRDNKITDITASLLIEYSNILITQLLESLPESETCKP